MCIIIYLNENSIMPRKLGWLSNRHGSMSDKHIQPFSANASEGEGAEQCFTQILFENPVFWYTVLSLESDQQLSF